ncbi:4Fe-4S binding protein [Adlercreutzia sp. ZJ242]|uniref:4Fe-4S binding protein n=1 Tax=Adlercreutzia sp. ZJ242 TaxID=2709409 RepID=UPI001F15287B|nr:4Fe-4S binding protein [Adlercreutzia sp. ZJ242]
MARKGEEGKATEAVESRAPHGALKTARVRFAVAVGVLALAAVGYFTATGMGNACAGGWGDLVLLCPLGALTAMVAQHAIIPQAVVSLVLAAAVLLVGGRFFCSWVCPTVVLGKVLPSSRGLKARGDESAGCSEAGCAACARGCGKARGVKLDSRHAILAAAVVSTLIFGFPVFCLVCPVGLTFAGVLLVMRLFAFGEVTWAVLAIPAILAVELALLPRWCQNICPLGALQSLVAVGNRMFVPTVDRESCLKATRGVSCDACVQVCPEGINLHDVAAGATTLADCTKCRDCADVCPAGAISFPLLPKGTPKISTVSASEPDEPGDLREA